MHVSLSATHTFEVKRVYQRQNKGLKRVISLATQGIYLKSVYRGKKSRKQEQEQEQGQGQEQEQEQEQERERKREKKREKKEREKRERKKRTRTTYLQTSK